MKLLDSVKRAFSKEEEPMIDYIPKFIYDPETMERMKANISDINHERWKIPDLDNGGYKKDSNGRYEYVNTNWVAHPEKRGFVSIWEIDHPLANAWKALRLSGQDVEAYDSEVLRARERTSRMVRPVMLELYEKKKYLDVLRGEKKRLLEKGLDFLIPSLDDEILRCEIQAEKLNNRFRAINNLSDKSFENEVASFASKKLNAVKPYDLLKTRKNEE